MSLRSKFIWVACFAVSAHFLFLPEKSQGQTHCRSFEKDLDFGPQPRIVGSLPSKDDVGRLSEDIPLRTHFFDKFSELQGLSLVLKGLVLSVKARTPGSRVGLLLPSGSNNYRYDDAPVPLSRNFNEDATSFFFEVDLPVTGPTLYADWILRFEGEAKLLSVRLFLEETGCDNPNTNPTQPPPISHDPQYAVECLWQGRSCQPFFVTSVPGKAPEKRPIGFSHSRVRFSAETCSYLQSKLNQDEGIICALDERGYFRPFLLWEDPSHGLGDYGFGEEFGRNYFEHHFSRNFHAALEDCVIAVQNILRGTICLPYFDRSYGWGYVRLDFKTNRWQNRFFSTLDNCAYSW